MRAVTSCVNAAVSVGKGKDSGLGMNNSRRFFCWPFVQSADAVADQRPVCDDACACSA